MRHLIKYIFIFITLTTQGQTVKELNPTLGYMVHKTAKGEREFKKQKQLCEKIWNRVTTHTDYQKLSAAEKKLCDNCEESMESYWDIFDAGCSWYCGGGPDSIAATSTLKNSKTTNYAAKNIHDLSYKTAWVEGVPGYGIGESVTYHFAPQTPRITEIIIVNGYVKSQQLWQENSRVKKLKMYIDNKPFAVLNLVDTRQEQHFKFEPLGYADRDNYELLKKKPRWTIRFEIVEVYKGNKFDDTAITEIYFDGIDVH